MSQEYTYSLLLVGVYKIELSCFQYSQNVYLTDILVVSCDYFHWCLGDLYNISGVVDKLSHGLFPLHDEALCSFRLYPTICLEMLYTREHLPR